MEKWENILVAMVLAIGIVLMSATMSGCLTSRINYRFGMADFTWLQQELQAGEECEHADQCRSGCCDKGRCAPLPLCARR
ncbi:MAG: hypothetical protein ABIG66_05545 [Candidatus Kerfeldbacteria bacterium]